MLDRAEVVTVACAGPDDCVDPLSEFFGSALAAGDVDGDGYADLAVGVPGESFGPCCPAPATGAHGDRSARRRGHPPAPRWAERDICGGQRVLEPGLAGVQDQAESHAGSTGGACCGDGFGSALAIGDFNDDGRGDLAIGVPREHVPGAPCWEDPCWHGAVNVLYGTGSGLTAAEDDYWPAQDFLPGARWAYADLGSALSAGDVNGDGVDDLAVGAPGHDVSESASGAGGWRSSRESRAADSPAQGASSGPRAARAWAVPRSAATDSAATYTSRSFPGAPSATSSSRCPARTSVTRRAPGGSWSCAARPEA
ncbi:MAG: hypothetical protein M3Q27_09765 [Actinomycetota bacterium]|nr:hypothetical protein [Actinomycetota bacterium]